MAYRIALGSTAAGFLEMVDMDSRRPFPVTSPAGTANAVAFSRDGKYMAVGRTISNAPIVYDTATWEQVAGIATTPNSGDVADIMFSPDGTRLAIAFSTAPYIVVYDTATWGILSGSSAPTGPASAIRSVAFSPDGTILAVLGGGTPFLWLYNAADMSRLLPSGFVPPTGQSSSTGGSARFSPDGTKLAVGGSFTPYLTVYNVGAWTKQTLTTPPTGNIYDVAWSPDGQSLAAVGQTSPMVHVWNTATYTRRTIPGTTILALQACAFTPDSKQLAVLGASYYGNTGGLVMFDTATWNRNLSPLGVSVRPYNDVQFWMDPPRYIRGTVRDVGGNPVARKVRAYLRTTGDIIGETTSNATTGNYELIIYRAETDLIDLQFLTADGELLNDLFFARASTAVT